jgi:hypothetical protein
MQLLHILRSIVPSVPTATAIFAKDFLSQPDASHFTVEAFEKDLTSLDENTVSDGCIVILIIRPLQRFASGGGTGLQTLAAARRPFFIHFQFFLHIYYMSSYFPCQLTAILELYRRIFVIFYHALGGADGSPWSLGP